MILLNKNNLRIANLCAKEESRYTLNAMHVSDKGTCVTDEHRLVRVSLPTVAATNFPTVPNMPVGDGKNTGLLPKAFVAKLEKQIPNSKTLPVLNNVAVSFDADRVNVAVTDLDTSEVLSSKQTAGNFPNVEAVIPDKMPIFEYTVNADYLMDLARSASAHADNKCPVLKLKFYSENESLRMDCTNGDGQTWTAVVMPLRSDATKGYTPIKSRLRSMPKRMAGVLPLCTTEMLTPN